MAIAVCEYVTVQMDKKYMRAWKLYEEWISTDYAELVSVCVIYGCIGDR